VHQRDHDANASFSPRRSGGHATLSEMAAPLIFYGASK